MNLFNNKKDKVDTIKCFLNKNNLILLKQRNINLLLTNYISTLEFSLNHNFVTKKEIKNIYIQNIKIKNFILNITPNGLLKISKDSLSGLEENKKRIKAIEDYEKQKEKKKQDPGKENTYKGPGE